MALVSLAPVRHSGRGWERVRVSYQYLDRGGDGDKHTLSTVESVAVLERGRQQQADDLRPRCLPRPV